jgi:heme/copper-type cytochrome/quinol oxidase subunit 3
MFFVRLLYLNCILYLFMSYTPILFFLWFWCFFIAFILSFCFFGFIIFHFYFVIFSFLLVCFFLMELFFDSLRGYIFVTLCRCIQYCFLWFIFSEISLFFSLFWLVFSCLFFLGDFVAFLLFPLVYLCVLIDIGFCNYLFFVDFGNICINTSFLFISGLCLNVFVIFLYNRSFIFIYVFLCLCVCFGFLFLINQLYDFNILLSTISVCSFISGFLLIDFLHFFHVFFGMLLLLLLLLVILSSDFLLVIIISDYYYY